MKYGLPIISPVDDDGKFTEEAGQFSGLDVLGDGNTAVVKYLDDHFSLILEESYGKSFTPPLPATPAKWRKYDDSNPYQGFPSLLGFNMSSLLTEHKYPYDWRTKKPTIFRATEQWFASVEGFRQAAVDAIGEVKWIPPQVFMLELHYRILLVLD